MGGQGGGRGLKAERTLAAPLGPPRRRVPERLHVLTRPHIQSRARLSCGALLRTLCRGRGLHAHTRWSADLRTRPPEATPRTASSWQKHRREGWEANPPPASPERLWWPWLWGKGPCTGDWGGGRHWEGLAHGPAPATTGCSRAPGCCHLVGPLGHERQLAHCRRTPVSRILREAERFFSYLLSLG